MGETSDGVRVLSPKVRPTHFNATAAKPPWRGALAGSDRAPGAVAEEGLMPRPNPFDVFINCLIDDVYRPTFHGMVFTLVRCRLPAEMAIEVD